MSIVGVSNHDFKLVGNTFAKYGGVAGLMLTVGICYLLKITDQVAMGIIVIVCVSLGIVLGQS